MAGHVRRILIFALLTALTSGAFARGVHSGPIVLNGDIKELLVEAEGQNGVLDPLNLVDKYLPDPMTISDFNVTESGRMTNFRVFLKAMVLKGLKGMDIDSMRFNLGFMHVDVVMSLPGLRLEGDYGIDGKIMLMSLHGKGPFYMDVSRLKIYAKAALRRDADGTLEVGEMVLDLDMDDLDMHFSNLMGNGKWSKFSNSVLNKMSHLIFDHVKYMLLDELSADIKVHLNEQLSKLPKDFVTKRSESLFDDLLAKVAEEVATSGFDPLKLPDQSEQFNHDLGFMHLHGQARVYHGILYGLKTLVRTGDVVAIYENDSVTLEANLGFENLTGSYDWRASLFGPSIGGSSTLHVSSIQAFVKLRQGLKRGDRPWLDTLSITNFKNIWIDLTGLGTFDFVVEAIVNLVTNTFKMTLADIISGPIKNVLQTQLDQLPMNFFV